MTKFKDFLEDQLKDPEMKAEWDALQPERALAQAIMDAHTNFGLTQEQISARAGISRADMDKIETGAEDSPLRTLQRLASGMNMVMRVEFLPLEN